jgi:hypothetical protein
MSIRILFSALFALAVTVMAQEPAPDPAAEPAAAPKIVVFLPEQLDDQWFWFFYSETSQHIVQSAVEKQLINAGFDVIDIGSIRGLEAAGSLDRITSVDGAKDLARQAGADYAIVGRATAVKSSQGSAYGVNVIRSNAEITAKIIRVADGKVIGVEDASAQKGGQAARAAGQEALKDAGNQIARKLAGALRRITDR